MSQAQLIVGSVSGDGTSRKPVVVDAAGRLQVGSSNALATYVYSIFLGSAPNPVIPATPTDFFFVAGSAGKLLRLVKVILSGTATAASALDIYILKRSTLDTAGGATFNAVTGGNMDSSNVTSSASVNYVTVANPGALGAAAAVLAAHRLAIGALAAPTTPNMPVVFDFGAISQPVVIRGVNEGVYLNLLGQALPAGLNLGVSFIWTEE